jgi:hypothetical protein
MPADIAACGFLGIAQEATPGVYEAPTKFFPIQSESLTINQNLVQRRGIRGTPDIIGSVAGSYVVEGDIEMEAFDDVVPYFLLAARTTVTKGGSAPNFTYQFRGGNCAGYNEDGATLSVTILRNGVAHGFVGVQVGSFEFTESDGILMFRVSVMGRDEADQSVPSPVFPTTQIPYGPGSYDIEVPTSTDVADVETFSFSVDDSISAADRLRAVRTPAFLHYGERSTALSLTRDFEDRTDFDSFKAATAQSVTIKASRGANNEISILMPVAYKESYEHALSGQGDLIQASISYFGAYGATEAGSYQIDIKTQEDITIA